MEGEETSPTSRLMTVADVANGIGARLDPMTHTFMNTDVSVHLQREPEGEWTGIEAETSVGPDGIATSAAVLHGAGAPLGRIAQTTLVQRPTVEPLLPIVPAPDTDGIPGNQFLWEPSASAVLEQLLPRYIATRIYQAVLETTASEQSSRMVAMRNATDNAQGLREDRTLTYNKVRQANITRERSASATGASSCRVVEEVIRTSGEVSPASYRACPTAEGGWSLARI